MVDPSLSRGGATARVGTPSAATPQKCISFRERDRASPGVNALRYRSDLIWMGLKMSVKIILTWGDRRLRQSGDDPAHRGRKFLGQPLDQCADSERSGAAVGLTVRNHIPQG